MRISQVAVLLSGYLLAMTGCASTQNDALKLRAGYDALQARQLDQAMTAANEVLASGAGETLPAEAHYLRGRVYEERALTSPGGVPGNLQSARTEYITALGLPHKPDLEGRAQAGVAQVAFNQDDYSTALQQWSAAYEKLEKPGDKVLTLYRMGQSAQRLGHWDEADQYFATVQQSAAGSDVAIKAKEHQGVRAFTVQLATFADARQADAAVADLRKQGVAAGQVADTNNRALHLLRVGPLGSYTEAKSVKTRFGALYPSAVILP